MPDLVKQKSFLSNLLVKTINGNKKCTEHELDSPLIQTHHGYISGNNLDNTRHVFKQKFKVLLLSHTEKVVCSQAIQNTQIIQKHTKHKNTDGQQQTTVRGG